jgi:hypothetical protein
MMAFDFMLFPLSIIKVLEIAELTDSNAFRDTIHVLQWSRPCFSGDGMRT